MPANCIAPCRIVSASGSPPPAAADLIELHPEVLTAAQQYFGLRPGAAGGRAMLGDAAALVPGLAWGEGGTSAAGGGGSGGGGYDFILHDVFR